ncbi:related to SSK1 - two-component signal transducer [Ustilago trichophora]|uniref:Related to SSK1 - two-component signal transducer n=1 Tax=Ustilago trichophora TaxID=86804 RepID=A0A5C3DQY6_9BASI|nr:related to SSK1 - two-component signal transducer [Ustilago trichophora]
MSTEPSNRRQGQTNSSSSNPNGSSDLNFTSSDSNDQTLLPPQAPRSPSKSAFQWPSEPLNNGRPSLPQESQKSVDDANRDILDRITSADQDATSHPDQSQTHPGLDHPRLSAQLAATLNSIEQDRRHQLSPTSTPFLPSASSLPMLSPQPQSMQRSSSNGTNKSAGSDKPDPSSSASQHAGFLPDMFRNAATMPLNLLRSLIPDNTFPVTNDEGLSASTLQVPVTSFNALFEACKALEWLAAKAHNFETQDKASGSRRNSTTQQMSEDGTDFAYFDYLQLLQKVADVVSGLAASRGIDLVLDLNPKLQGQPADGQRHYKLGSCSVWGDRIAMTFLFMSCISRLLHSAPVQSSVIITSTLTQKEESVVRPDSNSEMKLMILSIGLRLILPHTVASTPELMAAISGTPASLLLDAFGARLTTEQSTSQLPGYPDRVAIEHSINVSVGQLPESDEAVSLQEQQETESSKRIVGPDEQELIDFAFSLQGKKVALYSTSHSLFARQLSTLLSELGCDIAPVFSDSIDESSFDANDHVFGKQAHTAVALTSGRPALVSYTSDIDRRVHPVQSPAVQAKDTAQSSDAVDTAVLDPVTGVPVTFDNSSHQPPVPKTKPGAQQPDSDKESLSQETQIDPTGRRVVPFSFVIIDDDIVTLQKELLRIRSAVPLLKSALTSKSSPSGTSAKKPQTQRPTLDHRTKSSPQVNRLMASQPEASHSRSFGSLGSVLMKGENEGHGNGNDKDHDDDDKVDHMDESVSQTIIFFTSMKSYRLVRDTVQPIIDSASFRGVSSPPEIMVLPKPAGAKRILTALHLAEHKPVVRLPFLPIATSPLSPLTTHAKTWWTPDASHKQDGQGIMTLTRRQTASTDADFDTMPSTPWTPIDATKPSETPPTPQVPLTSETLPLAGKPSAQGAGGALTTHTQETAKDAPQGVVSSSAATTTKSAPRSTASRQTGRNVSGNANAVPPAAAAAAAADTSTQKSTNASSAPGSNPSPTSSVLQNRSHPVSSPMPADALEYFSETAAKMGGSAASGMVIQSPDGRPAGIFFQPSVSGSKPALSRGVSASSLRRSHHTPSDHGDRSDSAPRERRLTNRSNASSSASTRGGNEGSQIRASNLPTLSEQRPSIDSTETSAAPQLQVPNGGKYPTGSMFAPQVGIHSVLNSSRPPMTTPLGPSLPTPPAQEAGGGGANDVQQPAAVVGDESRGGSESVQQADMQNPESAAAATSVVESDSAKPVSQSGPSSSKSVEFGTSASAATANAIGAATRKSASRPSTAAKSSTTTAAVAASPSTKTAPAASARHQPRLPFPTFYSSSDATKTKPSAVPQSGFMMGMGFTSSARRGRGPKKAPVREAVLPPIKVLIVEDNPINQRILSMFMGKKKIKYDVANNGREAVEKWKTGGYHLILMDIQLPVMDGIEATKEIRKLERNANIGILPNTPPVEEDGKKAGKAGGGGGGGGGGGEGGEASRLTAKGLVKQGVAGSDSARAGGGKKLNPASVTGSGVGTGSGTALINGIANVSTCRTGGGINPFRASVIIVALTASVLSSDRVEALAAGCNDFLNKPVSLPWLNQKILEWGSMMYLMYSGLSLDEVHSSSDAQDASGKVGGDNKAQLHLGFGYGPAEKAKALANNLHLGDSLKAKKMKKLIQEKAKDMDKPNKDDTLIKKHHHISNKFHSQQQQQHNPDQSQLDTSNTHRPINTSTLKTPK